jgi:predicted alpha/beta hydrolase
MQKTIITARDGYKLSALFGTPVAESVGTIVISPATGVKKEFYVNFAKYLIQNGYKVLLFDYRGIGGSAPESLKESTAFMHEWGTEDMNAVLNYLVEERKFRDIIWLGHSVGGQLIGFSKHTRHIKKVIALSAAFGYWGYLPFPMKWMIWALWFFVGPVMVGIYGYGLMSKIGWGEDLPPRMMKEWRAWCLSKRYFTPLLEDKLKMDKFYNFTCPITAVYISDDFIANKKTVNRMMEFFPNSPNEIIRLSVKSLTPHRVGHMGIFRKKFERNLWPELVNIIERPPVENKTSTDQKPIFTEVPFPGEVKISIVPLRN